MTSDIPGQTWGTVTAMAQAGIRYFSTAPNYSTESEISWRNGKTSPSTGFPPRERRRSWSGSPIRDTPVLSHLEERITPKFVEAYVAHLEKTGYPYELAHLREWTGRQRSP